MRRHDLVHHGQAQTRALTLGGEIGIKNMSSGGRGDTRARIPHHQADPPLALGDGQGHVPAIGHGVQRVEAEIEQGLTHAFRIHQHIGYAP